MRILWITNSMMPPICEAIGRKASVTGGWMFSSLKILSLKKDYHISVATIYNGNEYVDKVLDGVRYILLPLKGKNPIQYNHHLENLWVKVKEEVKPEIVHIHGSEFPHGLAYVNACGGNNVVVSIQGIISEISKHYCDGLPYEVVKSRTIRDRLRKDGIEQQRAKFESRGKYEIDLLQSISNVIGRTDWDKLHVKAINPQAHYYFCGETLRSSFYEHKWGYEDCEPHSIFLSQGSYPIKGLHVLLKALSHVVNTYPDTKLYVGGMDITAFPWYRIGGYGEYIKRLISDLKLEDHVFFCGQLPEEKMRERYLKANVFVCPSSIENSSNSVGEAQLLKMPLLCSFVGGVPDLVDYNREVLYRFSDDVSLAEKIIKVFMQGAGFKPLDFDLSRYDAKRNLDQLESAYHLVLNSTPK